MTGATGPEGQLPVRASGGRGATMVQAVVENSTEAATLGFLDGTHVHGLDLRDEAGLTALVAATEPNEV